MPLLPTVEPVVAQKPKTEKRKKPKRQPRYNVILWNDDDHTFAYVMTMLLELFGHPLEKGFQLAEEVDNSRPGHRADHDQGTRRTEARPDSCLRQGQLIKDCLGSMWCSIEPVEEG